VDWRALAKIYTEKKKKERTKRLMEPADPRVSKYGQGRRSQKAKEGRTILFNMAMKTEAGIHSMAMRYAMNKISTREFSSRQTAQQETIRKRGTPKIIEEEDTHCPMCSICEQRRVTQTKEHIWGGHCIVTKTIGERMMRHIMETIAGWKCTQGMAAQVLAHIEKEWNQSVEEYKDGDIEKHAAGMGLIGIWTNKTIQGITKILTQHMGWTEELAMERSKDLAYLNMQYATEINKLVKHNEKILLTKVQKSEEEMIKFQQGTQNQWIHYKLTKEEIKEAACIKDRMNWLKGRVPAEIREMMTKK